MHRDRKAEVFGVERHCGSAEKTVGWYAAYATAPPPPPLPPGGGLPELPR